ncbi:uncharacterized protein LOC114526376 [Dendronephthya gigantea]|uniref:uncharacterized protein LOC114526376 n=1 Tax=Dendronephthya gigantea TaxID=151771 RepID=UPI00106C26A1|nr:uncharacterized protein LOC114526376 [Dendronephthya gigantea]
MLLLLSSTRMLFCSFFLARILIYSYQLSCTVNSLKTRIPSAKSSLIHAGSNPITSKPSTAFGIKKKNIAKQSLTKQASKKEKKFTRNEKTLLKLYLRDFKTGWYRVHRAKFDWKGYLAPCAKHTKWGINSAGWKNRKLKTCAANSFISKWDIRPAGEFSRFFIQSKTSNNHTKNIGGDSWRVHIKGRSSVSATVFDHNNGVYEVLFLLMEAGFYQIEITLDYTLCDGFKDPPAYWYKKGCTQGKRQPKGILKGDYPFLAEIFGHGKSISMVVPESKHSKKLLVAMAKIRRNIFRSNASTRNAKKGGKKKRCCSVNCPSLIFDGLGRWIHDKWKPYIEENDLKREPHNHEGILWVYGDSVSRRFAESLMVNGSRSVICRKIFKRCKLTYTWVYNVQNELRVTKNGKDYNHKKVMREINKVLDDKELDEHSVILLNWGIHFVHAVNFANFQKLIDDFITTVEHKRRKGQFKSKIIWRTTTAIFRERLGFPHRDSYRFLTFSRIILFNAYATSAMCKAGIDVIDVYPMTDSFPPGTVSKRDPFHYRRHPLRSVEKLLYHKFKP